MTTVLHNYLVIGAILFCLGAVGFLTRRNLFILVLSAEMMLQGVALNLVAFGRFHGNLQGQAFTLFMLAVAGCEAALALALILALFQQRKTLDVVVWHELGESPPGPLAEEAAAANPVLIPAQTPGATTISTRSTSDNPEVGTHA